MNEETKQMNESSEVLTHEIKCDLREESPQDTPENIYDIDVKYEGYLVRRSDGRVEFFKKKKKKQINGLITTKQTDSFTIQENNKFIKVTLVLDRPNLTFNYLMSNLDELVNTLRSLKILKKLK